MSASASAAVTRAEASAVVRLSNCTPASTGVLRTHAPEGCISIRKRSILVFPNALSPRVQWIVDTMIPVSSAISVDHAMVHHQSSAFTLIGSPQSLESFADHSAKECDLGHIRSVQRGPELVRPAECREADHTARHRHAAARSPGESLRVDCPRVRAASVVHRCGVHYPQLLSIVTAA